jgi:glycosyltransferase involved in cell wall biosynthesis
LRVVVDARLVTYQRAGIGTYLLSLLASLRDVVGREQLLVLISRRDPDVVRRLPDLPTRAIWTPPHHRLEQVALPLELAAIRGDVYHAPDFIPPFVRRVPAVVTIHDLAFLKWPELLTAQSRRYYGQVARAVRSADRVIAVSTRTRDDLVELVDAPARRIDVVYEAADARFRPADGAAVAEVRRRLGLPERYFLFVGTREPRKNLRRLLEAYALVADDLEAPDLVIAGRVGWIDEDLEGQATILGVGARVHFTGGVADEDLPALYSGAVAFVLPSIYEGFGLPTLEAMACETPVIASTGGSLPEIVGDAGLLVDPFNVSALAAALGRIWREPGLRGEMVERGRARASQFSWRRAAEETLDVYRRAA